MKSLDEQDHYEILEVPVAARPDQIERSYKLARATYAEDSLAGYSVFADGDPLALRERIDAAYRVLSDAKLRTAYDSWLERRERERALEVASKPAAESAPEPTPVPRDEAAIFDELEDPSGEFDGARLRRRRLGCVMELADVSAITKINPTYLRYIEEDRFEDLPAPVYVQGFVSAFASCLGLDGRRVSGSYMKRYREQQSADTRRR